MQDRKSVRVFLEVAAQHSFAAAARSLRMTPATVTRIVVRLEEELGQQLLVRTTRQVSLTSTGSLVVERYRPLVEAFDQVEQDLKRENQSHRGRLSISAPMSLGLRIMPNLVGDFRLACPNIDLNIGLTDRLVDIVSGICDLAIRVSSPPTDKSTIWRKLCAVPMRIVAAPSLFDRHPMPRAPEDLNADICFSYGVDALPEVWPFEKGTLKRPFTAGRSIQTNNGDLLYQFAQSGAGIVVLPEFLVVRGIRVGEVVPILEDWSLPPLWLSLFYPPYKALPPLVATFTDFFEGHLKDLEGFEF